jgi:hypothetical protein
MQENSYFLESLNKREKSVGYCRYYCIGGSEDKRVSLLSSFDVKADSRLQTLATDHSGLIPKNPKNRDDIEISAISEIVEIIRKEGNIESAEPVKVSAEPVIARTKRNKK